MNIFINIAFVPILQYWYLILIDILSSHLTRETLSARSLLWRENFNISVRANCEYLQQNWVSNEECLLSLLSRCSCYQQLFVTTDCCATLVQRPAEFKLRQTSHWEVREHGHWRSQTSSTWLIRADKNTKCPLHCHCYCYCHCPTYAHYSCDLT